VSANATIDELAMTFLQQAPWHAAARALARTGKSYVNCQQDIALPHSMPWHPRLSERLGVSRLVECPGSHELQFTDPPRLAEAIRSAGRD
jgi:hypothetical protein